MKIKCLNDKINTLKKDKVYEVITISIEKEIKKSVVGFYIINEENCIYKDKKHSITICPKEFFEIDDFWLKLSDLEDEAVICLKKDLPELQIGI